MLREFTESEVKFIELQANFQLGVCGAPARPLEHFFAIEKRRRSSLFMFFDPATQQAEPADRWAGLKLVAPNRWAYDTAFGHGKGYRNADFLNSILNYGLDIPAFSDMQDAIYAGAKGSQPSSFPMFQYNRIVNARNAILWPLKGFQDIGDSRYIGSGERDSITFKAKEPKLFWRGALVGHSHVDGKRTNIQFVIQAYLSGKINKDMLMCHLDTIPRYRFIKKFSGHPKFDIGLIIPKRFSYYSEVDEIRKYARDFVSRENQLQYRYLIAISGNDVATSFAWTSETNSLVFKEKYNWQTFYDCHFVPDIHFVPFEYDHSDIMEKFDWAESHVEDCEAMTREANAVCRLLADRDLREAALTRVVDLYRDWFFSQKLTEAGQSVA